MVGLELACVGRRTPDVAQMAEVLREIVARQCANFGLAIPELAFEPGAQLSDRRQSRYTVGTVKPIELTLAACATMSLLTVG